jgi:alpha-glucosidase
VFYEIYVRSFADSDGDGVGDLDGIRSRLPYVRDLGVDGIWLTPFFRSPMVDHGYDVADPRDVDPLFGDLAAFDRLVARAHALGLAVLVDLVPNHSSDAHPAFQAALAAGPGSAERGRYLFRDGRGPHGASPPNNWGSVFGGPAWTRVADGQWYLHLFAPEQPDWNWRDPAVRDDYDGVLRFWLDRGVDGFRIDVTHGLVKDPTLADHPPGPAATPMSGFREEFEPGAWDQDEVHEVYRRWRPLTESYPPVDGRERILAGETWVADPHRLARYVRPDELHLAFAFSLLTAPWQASAWRGAIERDLSATAAVGAPTTWAIANHDVVRPASRYGAGRAGARRARAALLTMLALPGVSFLYQGDELGLPEADVPPAERQDPIWTRSGHTSPGRDGCRIPMPWSGTSQPFGFSPSSDVRPWLPQPSSWAPLTAERQATDPGSTLVLVRGALAVRRALPAFRGTTLAPRADGGPDTLCFDRAAPASDRPGAHSPPGMRLRCVMEMGPDEVTLAVRGRLVLASEPVAYDGEQLVLEPDTTAWVVLDGPAPPAC